VTEPLVEGVNTRRLGTSIMHATSRAKNSLLGG